MTVSESAVYSAAFLDVRSARVTLTLADGRIQSAETTARGRPRNPLTDPEVTEKFRRLSHPVLGVARSDRIGPPWRHGWLTARPGRCLRTSLRCRDHRHRHHHRRRGPAAPGG